MNTSQWTPICLIDDIPVLGARRVARERGLDVAIFRTGQNQVFACSIAARTKAAR